MTADQFARPLAAADAPGKVILLGEHAVVYRRPALAVPVHAVSARATVWASDRPLHVHAAFPDGDERPAVDVDVASAPPTDPIATAVRLALDAARPARDGWPAWRIDLESSVPVGSGMGSSAAVAVALVRAVGLAAGAAFDEPTVSGLAYEAERCTHGTPSGIDNSVVALGRPIRFAGGHAAPIGVRAGLDLVIADTGFASLTREAVAGVRVRFEARPVVFERWFDQIARLVDDAAAAIATGDIGWLGRLLNANHLILQAMGVSTPQLDALVGAARAAGAAGAKLSGAGAGGVMTALVTPASAASVSDALRAAGARRIIHAVVAPTP